MCSVIAAELSSHSELYDVKKRPSVPSHRFPQPPTPTRQQRAESPPSLSKSAALLGITGSDTDVKTRPETYETGSVKGSGSRPVISNTHKTHNTASRDRLFSSSRLARSLARWLAGVACHGRCAAAAPAVGQLGSLASSLIKACCSKGQLLIPDASPHGRDGHQGRGLRDEADEPINWNGEQTGTASSCRRATYRHPFCYIRLLPLVL